MTGYTGAASLNKKTTSNSLQESVLILDRLYFLVSMIIILEAGPQISTRMGNTIAEMSGKFPKSLTDFPGYPAVPGAAICGCSCHLKIIPIPLCWLDNAGRLSKFA
jgi:hypothetical protein